MKLREILNLCQAVHADDWIGVPGESHPVVRIATGRWEPNHLAVYEPDPSVSMAWLVPSEPEGSVPRSWEASLPAWAEEDLNDWKGSGGYCVVLLNGAPVWQNYVWDMTWGAGVSGYVAAITEALHDGVERGYPASEKWTASAWAISQAQLLDGITGAYGDWPSLNPTSGLVKHPRQLHPIDERRNELLPF